MTALRLPGLVDVHTHMREPGQTHKEDWSSGTAAALAGGFTTVLAMPNTDPPVVDETSFASAAEAAQRGSRVAYGLLAGATSDNMTTVASLAPRVAGLKMYLDTTFGDLRLADLDVWWHHLDGWPSDSPVAVHAEGRSLGAILLMAQLIGRGVHVCHVSRRDEILLIRRAKEAGLPVTCEVAPHHLVLDEAAADRLGATAAVRPPLGTPADRQALWDHLEVIDCFATDHAPHTAAEKAATDAPPGYPGLEVALPLLLTEVHRGRLELDDVVSRLDTGPRTIFGLAAEPDTWVEVDVDDEWVVSAATMQSRAGWSPYDGMTVWGRVRRVVRRDVEVFDGETVLAPPGSGANVKEDG